MLFSLGGLHNTVPLHIMWHAWMTTLYESMARNKRWSVHVCVCVFKNLAMFARWAVTVDFNNKLCVKRLLVRNSLRQLSVSTPGAYVSSLGSFIHKRSFRASSRNYHLSRHSISHRRQREVLQESRYYKPAGSNACLSGVRWTPVSASQYKRWNITSLLDRASTSAL